MSKTTGTLILAGFIFCCHCPGFAGEFPDFNDFSGVCQMGIKRIDQISPRSFSYNRFDVRWHVLEPAPGKWDKMAFDKYKQKIIRFNESGVKSLVVLGFSVPWAYKQERYIFKTRRGPWSYEREYRKRDGGKWQYIVKRKKNGEDWEKTVDRIEICPKIPFEPAYVDAWKRYVAKVVEELSKPPYNVKYFQIWNEAHPWSGFYNGTLDQYMTQVHIPAAEVIKQAGAKVVYGGWPDKPPVSELVALLDKYQAWKNIDVIDTHYKDIGVMHYLRRCADQRGYRDMGVWQTEVSFSTNYFYIPENYPGALYMALNENWSYPDKYKMFFFPFWSAKGKKSYALARGLLCGDSLTGHAYALKTLQQVLGGGRMSVFKQIKTLPLLTTAPAYDGVRTIDDLRKVYRKMSVIGIRSGNKLLIVFLPSEKDIKSWRERNLNSIKCSVSGINMADIRSAYRLGVFGKNRLPIKPYGINKDEVGLSIPIKESSLYKDSFFSEKTLYRPVFYCVVEMKK